MKSLQKIQFLEMHLLQMRHPLHHKQLQNKKMKPQSRVLSLLYNLQLQMMMKMKSKCLQWATKELSMRLALKRNLPILFQPKELPLVPWPVGRIALKCQRGQEGEVFQRSPLSALTLPRSGGQGSSGRDRSPTRLPDGTKPSVPPKPGNQSKSKKDKYSPH